MYLVCLCVSSVFVMVLMFKVLVLQTGIDLTNFRSLKFESLLTLGQSETH